MANQKVEHRIIIVINRITEILEVNYQLISFPGTKNTPDSWRGWSSILLNSKYYGWSCEFLSKNVPFTYNGQLLTSSTSSSSNRFDDPAEISLILLPFLVPVPRLEGTKVSNSTNNNKASISAYGVGQKNQNNQCEGLL